MANTRKSLWRSTVRPIVTGPLVCIAFFKILFDLGLGTNINNTLVYSIALLVLIWNTVEVVREQRQLEEVRE